MTKAIPTILILTISLLLVLILAKGQMGLHEQLRFQYDYDIARGGPFEASNSNSRYALTQAIVENGSFSFTDKQAKFASPDLVDYGGKYSSIFMPGVSFFGVPFYMLGVIAGAPQLFTYFSTILLAILNLYLVYKISNKLGAGKYASLFAGFVFLFTTNAIAYALTYTQHHLSAAIILLGILTAFGERTWIKNLAFGVLFGAGLMTDIPNGLMLLPVLGYILLNNFSLLEEKNRIVLSVKWKIIGLVLGVAPLFLAIGLYNFSVTGSYTTLGQSIGRVSYEKTLLPQENTNVIEEEDSSDSGFNSPLELKHIPNGLYILLISNERGWIYYSPVIILGLIGLYLLSKNGGLGSVMFAVIGINILIYSMFGDPWGGWSFGPRYLIPATALTSVGLGLAIARFKRNSVFNLFLILFVIYGLSISIMGAMTSNNVPPKVEAIYFSDTVPYTYALNWQILQSGKSSSLFYDVYLADQLPAFKFYILYVVIAATGLIIFYLLKVNPEENINPGNEQN